MLPASKLMMAGIFLLLAASISFSLNPFKASALSPDALGSSISPAKLQSEITLNWVGCGISRKAFMRELAAAYTVKTGIKIKIEGGGATRGIRDSAALRSDLGGSCRHALSVPAEENARLMPVAWDALVVIVNPGNSVDEISLVQLRSVLMGNTKNWRQLGGADEKINLVIREQGPGGKISGVGMMARELIFFDREKSFTVDSISVKSTGPLEEIVEQDAWALGLTGVSSAKRREVKKLRLDGVAPSYGNIAQGKYPLFRPLYLVIPKTSGSKSMAEDFVGFASSSEGQKVIKASGTVTLEDGAGLWKKFRKKMFDAGVRMGDY